jgi:hypothetical protein
MVKQWSGNASRKTEDFQIVGSQWVINWESGPGEYGGGHFSIQVKDPNDPKDSGELLVNRTEPGRDYTVMRTPGRYFLEISGDDHPWAIRVSEFR